MNKIIDYTKLSKKAKRERDLAQRSVMGFNTGTRIHKTAKHPSRAAMKNNLRKTLDRM